MAKKRIHGTAALEDIVDPKTIEIMQREAVVKEALTWKGTPYHHMGKVKGCGTDCGQLLIAVFETVGLIPHIDPGYYPPDWHFHRDEEKYLGWVKQYTKEVSREPLPGDIILYQYGRCISHGAIVVEWPTIIHAYRNIGVVLENGTIEELATRQRAIYSRWG
jgi:cell wall-associated NlpC family hydrolase